MRVKITNGISKRLKAIQRSRVFPYVVFGAVLLAGYAAGRLFSLRMVTSISRFGIEILPVVLVVLHHEEISGAMASLGQRLSGGLHFSRHFSRLNDSEELVNEVVVAASAMAQRHVGGTIAFERRVGLRTDIERGVAVDAVVTADLIQSIFNVQAPLHDGAIVISDGRIAAARVFFPMTANPRFARDYGSRHQAAVGLTEGSDAIAVVISEQRGTISLASGGSLEEVSSPDQLTVKLHRLVFSRRGR